jgi:multiple sugar transport system permease protein
VQRGLFKYALLAPGVAVVAATLLYPLAQALWFSLHDWNLGRQATLGPFVGLENFQLLFTDDPDFWHSAWVTLVFTAISTAATLAVSLALAVLMAGSGPLEVNARTLLVIPFAMAPALIGVSWRFLLNPEFGAADAVLKALVPPLRGTALLADPIFAMAAMVFVDVWHWAPYFMLTFVGAMAALPSETLDAAEVDGAGKTRTFFEIILPQLRPVLLIAVLLKVIFSLKMLDQVITMTRGGPGTATSTLAYTIFEVAFRWFNMGYAAAMAYLLAAVMMLLAYVYSRMVLEKKA